jgi:hypothetical protein
MAPAARPRRPTHRRVSPCSMDTFSRCGVWGLPGRRDRSGCDRAARPAARPPAVAGRCEGGRGRNRRRAHHSWGGPARALAVRTGADVSGRRDGRAPDFRQATASAVVSEAALTPTPARFNGRVRRRPSPWGMPIAPSTWRLRARAQAASGKLPEGGWDWHRGLRGTATEAVVYHTPPTSATRPLIAHTRETPKAQLRRNGLRLR